MRESKERLSVAFLLFFMMITLPLASARSVHSSYDVDIFPQGDLSDDSDWTLDDGITFTSDKAQYTESMLEDGRLTFQHSRPDNFQTINMWSSNSPTDHTAATGSPDLFYSFSNGPEIELTDFDTTNHQAYEIVAVSVLIAFHIPGALQQDQVRFSMNYGGSFEQLATYVNTQSAIDYMNQTIWSKNITTVSQWTWSDLSEIIFTLDYVSLGTTDDTQLDVDALGLSVVVKYPWYGTEWASAESTFTGHEMPISSVNLSRGSFDNIILQGCGLTSSDGVNNGIWQSDVISTQPGQTLGRIHYALADTTDDMILEISKSTNGVDFDDFQTIDNHELIDDNHVIIRLTTLQSCINSISIDYNDPELSIDARVLGNVDGLTTYSRWKVFVNNQDATGSLPLYLDGDADISIPIGKFLTPHDESISVKIQTWFNWDSTGSSATTLFEVTSLSISGAFAVEWDEDPVCEMIGSQYFTEDGSGLLLPYLDLCSDDRTASNNLSVVIQNDNSDLISISMDQGDLKFVVKPQKSGTSTVNIVVSDEANNIWQETFVVYVEAVDDMPVVVLPAAQPVELGIPTELSFNHYDVDSTQLTAYTDKSWAIVDLETSTISVTPPNVGNFIPVVITVCDDSNCVASTLVLEVLLRAELEIEDIVVDSDRLVAGEVITIAVFVRNSGDVEASIVSVRCEVNGILISVQSLNLLEPNELRSVVCDWKVPQAETAIIQVELDRSNEVSESNETNNVQVKVVEISLPSSTASSDSIDISSSTVWIFTIIGVLAIVGLFTAFAPKKIRKV